MLILASGAACDFVRWKLEPQTWRGDETHQSNRPARRATRVSDEETFENAIQIVVVYYSIYSLRFVCSY